MENEIKLTVKEYVELKADSEKLKTILKIIFENTRIGYQDRLRIDEEEDLMTYLKIVEDKRYYERLEFLQNETGEV